MWVGEVVVDGHRIDLRPYADRLMTASVYERWIWSAETVRLMVMRWPPTFLYDYPYVEHVQFLPMLSPSVALLRAYRRGQVAWEAFVAQYLTQLEQKRDFRAVVWRDFLLPYLEQSPSVTLLCCERGDERIVRCHRRIVREWLLGEGVRP
jgi:uncharacterized protein YeaO (DUF488 family)